MTNFNTVRTVFCYISFGSEVDTRAVLAWLLAGGKQVCVPRITAAKAIEAVVFTGWNGLEPGPYGIPAPAGADVYTGDIDICITPGLGFSMNGGRLGHGPGYYDRWFTAHPVPSKIGLAYECQILDELPVEPHDTVMDVIITEERIIRP
jgi:5-formyltetrahydrofolate cyclo-ligase